VGYCTKADLYANGLPRGALSNPGRLAASVSVSANTIAMDQHALALNTAFTFRPDGAGTLPSPLVAGVTYYAIPVNDDTFSVAAAPNGSAIDLTTTGTGKPLVVVPVDYQSAIDAGAAVIDDLLPGHLVPLVAPYSPIIVVTNAELAIGRLMAGTGSGSKNLATMIDEARKRLADWARGRPLHGANVPPPANLSATAVATATCVDRRGWSRFGAL
jgi:hypothetical protein